MSTSETTSLKQQRTAANAAPADLTYTVGVRTDKGMQRSANEDAVAVLEVPGADAAFVVADGMGGLRAGDIASNEAVRIVQATLAARFTEDPSADLEAVMGESFRLANDAVNALARPSLPEVDETRTPGAQPTMTAAGGLMGTTCVLGLVRDGMLHLAHVGDSRAYLYRDNVLRPLTQDHSFVADRVRAGDMTEAEARSSRFRNMITRAIGIEPGVNPEFGHEPLRPGDTVLVCSDGLTTMLEDDEIAAVLSSRQTGRLSPDRAASALVDAANKSGGHDNITVVLMRVYAPGQEDALAAPTSPTTTATRPARGKGGAVINLDEGTARPNASGGNSASGLPAAWPLVAVFGLIGALALIAAGAIAASPDLRGRVAGMLGNASAGVPTTLPTVTPPKPAVDFAHLTYTPPQDFSKFLARGDLLSYSPGAGLYFVADSSGKMVSLSRSGEPQQPVSNLPPAPQVQSPIPDTHVFLTSDLQGNVYISYTKRKIVEKRSANGTALGTLTGFSRPEAIAVDEDGNLYVVDMNVIKILRAHASGVPPASATASGTTGAMPSASAAPATTSPAVAPVSTGAKAPSPAPRASKG